MARNVQALLREGNGDQKENIRVQDSKRGVHHLEEEEDPTELAGIGKKLKNTETVSCIYNDQVRGASLKWAPNESMRILSWNCRGMGEPFTIPQLKESIQLNLPYLVFLCETKQKLGFVGTVCKKLRFGNRWEEVESVGKKLE